MLVGTWMTASTINSTVTFFGIRMSLEKTVFVLTIKFVYQYSGDCPNYHIKHFRIRVNVPSLNMSFSTWAGILSLVLILPICL